jgi:hypothetical protein
VSRPRRPAGKFRAARKRRRLAVVVHGYCFHDAGAQTDAKQRAAISISRKREGANVEDYTSAMGGGLRRRHRYMSTSTAKAAIDPKAAPTGKWQRARLVAPDEGPDPASRTGSGPVFGAVDKFGNIFAGEPRPRVLRKYVKVR